MWYVTYAYIKQPYNSYHYIAQTHAQKVTYVTIAILTYHMHCMIILGNSISNSDKLLIP